MPGRIGCIISRASLDTVIKRRGEGYADCVPARIPARVSERADLIEMNAADTSLFEEFAGGGVFERLVLVDEATRESPQPFERLASALDQKHLYAIPVAMK